MLLNPHSNGEILLNLIFTFFLIKKFIIVIIIINKHIINIMIKIDIII